MVSQAIAQGDLQAVNYFVAQKYIEALAEIAKAPNNKLVLMPLEAASVIGSVAGIGDLVKDLKQGEKNTPPHSPAPLFNR